MPSAEPSPIVLTIGHSTRTLEEFIGLLQAHGATRVVDVRTVPRSRHNPQFDEASLPGSLKKAGLGYIHMPGLGGLRHAKRELLNPGWRLPNAPCSSLSGKFDKPKQQCPPHESDAGRPRCACA